MVPAVKDVDAGAGEVNMLCEDGGGSCGHLQVNRRAICAAIAPVLRNQTGLTRDWGTRPKGVEQD